ncbi:hypothetical protein CN894_11740 [Bacillus thuringiensis]|uniref:pyridoxal-phosphate-dependent aminotransferase family protein n=1 Tax=Bacillus thuringiensis TaxID=1428 RepID=UPI000BFC6631|nr:alanine--glyoxylate aminotransferase family protein [Bacillus thuringiensis]PGH72151.1 hypothetical protein CN894_11740 [Bacillus thuringiensis]
MEWNMRITGPTQLPIEVMKAMDKQMISHRSKEFRKLFASVIQRMLPLFGTTTALLLPFTTSGTGGLEAALVNTISPGDRVLSVQNGYFGERFAEIASAVGAEVIPFSVPWGESVDPDELRQRVREIKQLAAVLFIHNETSTGVSNPLSDLVPVVREESDALVLVDGVSSVGGMPVEMDMWGADVVVTVTQKALMAPPGIAIVAAGPRAMKAAHCHKMPRYYFDFVRMAREVESGTTSFTPAMSAIFALDMALDLIMVEGLPAVFDRHQRIASICRKGLRELGLHCFANKSFPSATVTAALSPEGLSASTLSRRLQDEHGVTVSQGRGIWKDQMIRIGHMGHVQSNDILYFLNALKQVIHS